MQGSAHGPILYCLFSNDFSLFAASSDVTAFPRAGATGGSAGAAAPPVASRAPFYRICRDALGDKR